MSADRKRDELLGLYRTARNAWARAVLQQVDECWEAAFDADEAFKSALENEKVKCHDA